MADLREYVIPTDKENRFSGWAIVVIGMDGFFSTVSDFGNFAYRWNSFGERDFREFFLDLEPDYLAGKLGNTVSQFDGDATAVAVEETFNQWVSDHGGNIDPALFYREEALRKDLGKSPSESAFNSWCEQTEIDELGDPHDLAVQAVSNTADAFAKHILPRLKEKLKAELAAEKKRVEPPPIAEFYRHNFETMLKAAVDGNLCLLSCVDKKTKEPRVVICARQEVSGGEREGMVDLIPIAKLFDVDPYDELLPPLPPLDS